MDKRVYLTPSFRQLALGLESNFLTSGFGEDADPQPGTWSTAPDPFDE